VASTRSAAPRSASRMRPWGNGMRWLLTGDEFNAAEALRIGLVQEVVEPGTQLDRAVELATPISGEAAPLGVRTTPLSARRAIADGPGSAPKRLTRNVTERLLRRGTAPGRLPGPGAIRSGLSDAVTRDTASEELPFENLRSDLVTLKTTKALGLNIPAEATVLWRAAAPSCAAASGGRVQSRRNLLKLAMS